RINLMTGGDQQLPFDFGGDDGSDEENTVEPPAAKPRAKRKSATLRKPTQRNVAAKKHVAAKKPVAASADEAISISEVTLRIKRAVESSLASMWVAGEITDIARPRSGHLYFTLKDEHSQLRGVMWRSVAER